MLQSNSSKRTRQSLCAAVATAGVASLVTVPVVPSWMQSVDASQLPTATPIKHIILIIGDNRTFDHVYATYVPKRYERVDNLLSKGIIKEDGSPGKNFSSAAQSFANVTGTYTNAPSFKGPYTVLPPAMTDGAPSAASNVNPPPFAMVAAVAAAESLINDGLRPPTTNCWPRARLDCRAIPLIHGSRMRPLSRMAMGAHQSTPSLRLKVRRCDRIRRLQLRAECVDSSDNCNADRSCNQPLFDCRLTGFVLDKPPQIGHITTPKRKPPTRGIFGEL
jgi:hypothetical protein